MSYKNKLYFLLSIIGVLVLLYIGSFIFSPEGSDRRSSSYVWLDERHVSKINKIDIHSGGQDIELVKKDREWFIIVDNIEYPAREHRIEDFMDILTKRSPWPVRSSNPSAHASFGLETGQADRVTFYDGNSNLLDILIGYDNVFGNEVSVRKFAQNEVRSGDTRIRTYVSSPAVSWYNLKLFPEEDGKIWSADSVQQLTVVNDGQRQVFGRINRAWTVTGAANPDKSGIDSYIRTVLNTEGDNFLGLISEETQFTHSSIIVEFGNGKIVTVNLSEPDEGGNRLAFVSNRQFVYSIPAWSGGRLFRDAVSFESQ
ncbi:MAG: DUF4340 domain-containing protein [Treponema sp.]|jgi:hypothetical protein|nr:DUF4340 domain-containing protein [Treponema sp.]